MKAEDILGLLVPATFIFFLVTERLFPRRQYPPIRFWNLIGFACLIMTGLISTFLPMLLPVSVTQYHLFNASGLGLVAGVLIAYPLTALGSALLHRSFHEFHPLWLMGHQLHHSPRRVDIPGSVFFHPVDLALQTAPATIVSLFVLGLDPVTAGTVGYVSAFYGMFQHWNVRTPRWLGYIIQRPESHGLHHELGVHGRNYSDFPLWDMLMGTFVNPETFDGDVGFAGDAPTRVGAMLLFRDVNRRANRRAPAEGPALMS
jgi:sterol desaturase/sphingolipid hydroxylase (fatty acid hydroxylase superfamily)